MNLNYFRHFGKMLLLPRIKFRHFCNWEHTDGGNPTLRHLKGWKMYICVEKGKNKVFIFSLIVHCPVDVYHQSWEKTQERENQPFCSWNPSGHFSALVTILEMVNIVRDCYHHILISKTSRSCLISENTLTTIEEYQPSGAGALAHRLQRRTACNTSPPA